MFNPYPMMFHPTLVVEDLEDAARWFRRVFGRREVRWEDKFDLAVLNPDYPINYSYFFVLGDVSLDVLCPSLLKLPGDRSASVYREGAGLVDIAWYTDHIEDVARGLERHGFRTRDQEGNLIHDGEVPQSNLVWDCPMIWTLPEDTGLTYEFYRMGRRHWPKYSQLADPRLDPAWRPGVVSRDDPLGIVTSAHHTVLTHDRERALRLFVEVLGGQIVGEGYSERLDADFVDVLYAKSVMRFATPRTQPIRDVISGEETQADQYVGITFQVTDLDAVAGHLAGQDVAFSRSAEGIHTFPAGSFGAVWGFTEAG
ncbi:VOC family protein [Georgenia daeguensis]|uniref:VOC domain-containing protein n=1 Tax=Georgenia daeguensis TaxID=908355 RepID=A0ABP6UMB1_9MICO